MIKNILLSGGWGYGNLGDDALLEASIKILKDQYPSAAITIMTYDPLSCKEVGCTIVPSLHRKIYGERAFKFLRIWGKSWNYDAYPSIIARTINKFERLLLPYQPQSDSFIENFKNNSNSINHFRELFMQADMFVMSGGGYFNKWEDSFNSRCMELLLAKECETPVYILGQTIGPFTKKQLEKVQPLLQGVKGIFVRDVESHKDLVSMGCSPILAPDLALSYVGTEKLKDEICVIPAEYPSPVRRYLIDALELISQKTNMAMTITATRLYNRDINCLKEVFSCLKARGLDVKMVVPTSYEEVKKTIKGNKYIISRNLHGLILGWREGSKCLCLCDERKFVSFMTQIAREDCIVDVYNANAETICQMFEKLMTIEENHLEKQKKIAVEVLNACHQTLNV